MKYTVTWVPSARADLARIWNQAHDRAAVADAANRIDRTLCRDPDRWGRPINGWRMLIADPLVVVFAIHPDDCLVEILQVARRRP